MSEKEVLAGLAAQDDRSLRVEGSPVMRIALTLETRQGWWSAPPRSRATTPTSDERDASSTRGPFSTSFAPGSTRSAPPYLRRRRSAPGSGVSIASGIASFSFSTTATSRRPTIAASASSDDWSSADATGTCSCSSFSWTTTSCILPAIRAGAAPRALAMGGAPQAPRAAEEGASEAAEPSPLDARDILPATSRAA